MGLTTLEIGSLLSNGEDLGRICATPALIIKDPSLDNNLRISVPLSSIPTLSLSQRLLVQGKRRGTIKIYSRKLC